MPYIAMCKVILIFVGILIFYSFWEVTEACFGKIKGVDCKLTRRVTWRVSVDQMGQCSAVLKPVV